MFAPFSPENIRIKVERERLHASTLAETLRALSHEDAKILAHSSGDYRTWGLCEHLIARSWETRFAKASETLEYAELALCVADQLDEDTYGAKPLADLCGRTWTILGNAHRITSDYRRAQECFKSAAVELGQGADTPILRAELTDAQAALLIDQGRYDAARRLLDEARALYEQTGDEQAAASVSVECANLYGFSGDLEQAITLLNETIPELDPTSNAATFYAATQALAWFLEEAGQPERALEVLRTVIPHYRRTGDTLNLARINWTQGKIARRAGNVPLAEGLFLSARRTFIEQGIGFDAAEVSLHLADIYLSTGRVEALFQLAAEIGPIFECRDMHEHAAGALVYLQTAIKTIRGT